MSWHSPGSQIEAGLGLSMSGYAHWSGDIGGFAGLTGGDLLARWMQLGVLHSHARIHGVDERDLDRFPEQVRDRCIDALRPLALEFPEDPTTWPIGDQWLLGDALLVAPVLDPSGHRRAYFPEGSWRDWWTGEVIEGSRWLDLDVPLDQIPLWLRAGRVVPLAPLIEHVDQRRRRRRRRRGGSAAVGGDI